MTQLQGYGAPKTLMGIVRDTIIAQMKANNVIPPVRVSIVPGAIAWDDCTDQCGLLALSAMRVYFTDEFPIETTTVMFKEGAFLGVDFIVQAIRCAPVPQNGALAPEVNALDASASEVLNDAWAVLCATTNTLKTMTIPGAAVEIIDYLVRQQIFMGPEGGCVGSELQFSVAFAR